MSIYHWGDHLNDLHDPDAILADHRHTEADEARAEELALFPAPDSVPAMTAARRYTIRASEALAAGYHPLSSVQGMPARKLHPDAPDPADRTAPGPRCGSCFYKSRRQLGSRAVLKCRLAWSGSEATDIRAWFPACADWKTR